MIWETERLWSKSKLYLRRAFDAGRESDLFPFWATIALEFFGRAVLAKINPCLLADPQTGENLLHACGFSQATDRPKSVPAKTVFLRVKTITDVFTEADFGFVMSLMDRRNEELHSGACPFEDLANKEWLPKYYRVCELLAEAHEFSFDELFGATEAAAAKRIIEETEKECTAQVAKRIAAFAITFEQMEDTLRKEKLANVSTTYLLTRGPKRSIECPSCKSNAILTGEEISTSDPTLVNDEICQETTVIPTGLRCDICGLQLSGLTELHAAKLDDQFVVRSLIPVAEYYDTEFVGDYHENEFSGRYYEPEYMNS
ncbi:MAG: hypothetical protein WD669_05590 [Pirellulales bacterium]